MFNLIVGYTPGRMGADRMLEHTSPHIREYLRPGGSIDTSRLLGLPTLVMPEVSGGDEDFARIGHIESVTISGGKEYRYNFVPTPGVRPIPSEYVVDAASALGIDPFEFRRTHWAVKEHDLYGALMARLVPPISPKVFNLPDAPREADLVAVMMPFDAGFTPVYTALREAVEDAGMRCERADDIWIHDQIMDDIISLIWRARVVIADLSNKNANVFYETGITHTLGRDSILITQSDADVPFDLRSLRHVRYHPNGEGLDVLKGKLTSRLSKLAARSV